MRAQDHRPRRSHREGADIRFVVANLSGRAKPLYEKVYCARGRMENMIKEHKLYSRSDRTSRHRWETNRFRLFLHTGANWLLHRLPVVNLFDGGMRTLPARD